MKDHNSNQRNVFTQTEKYLKKQEIDVPDFDNTNVNNTSAEKVKLQ